jgi:hypothetical protein
MYDMICRFQSKSGPDGGWHAAAPLHILRSIRRALFASVRSCLRGIIGGNENSTHNASASFRDYNLEEHSRCTALRRAMEKGHD